MSLIEIKYGEETFSTDSGWHAITWLSTKMNEEYMKSRCSEMGCNLEATCNGKCGAHCECRA